MKTTKDILLESKVSDMILEMVRDAMDGKFEGVPNGDIQAMCETAAVNIIETVKEQQR